MSIHKSLNDWLRDEKLSGQWSINEANGHAILGINLLREVTKAADAKDGAHAVEASKYSLKYALRHITKALAAGLLDLSLLNVVLGNWPFLRQVFRSGNLFSHPWFHHLICLYLLCRPWWEAGGSSWGMASVILIM